MRLAPSDQAVLVRTPEREVPESVILDDVVPRPDAGKRCIDQDESSHAIRVLGRERIADHVADVVRHEVDLRDLERVEHAGDVVALRLLVVAVGRAAPTNPFRADRE